MAALTKDRMTKEQAGTVFDDPVAAATQMYAGSLACLDASGNLVPGSTATTLTARGCAQQNVDNSSGAAGDLTCRVKTGVYLFANSAAGDEITRAEVGDSCYIVDDQTVAKTDGTGTRSVAGEIINLDTAGVWVKI